MLCMYVSLCFRVLHWVKFWFINESTLRCRQNDIYNYRTKCVPINQVSWLDYATTFLLRLVSNVDSYFWMIVAVGLLRKELPELFVCCDSLKGNNSLSDLVWCNWFLVILLPGNVDVLIHYQMSLEEPNATNKTTNLNTVFKRSWIDK